MPDQYDDLNDDDLAGEVIDAYVAHHLHRVNAAESEEDAEDVLSAVEGEACELANGTREDQLTYLRGED